MKAISCLAVVAALAAPLWAVGCGRAQRDEAGPTPVAEGQAPAMQPLEASGAAPVTAEATEPLIAQKTCPVMGGPIDPNIYLDYRADASTSAVRGARASSRRTRNLFSSKPR